MVTQPKFSLDGEKITKFIKEVLKQEFKKQKVNVTKIISSNFLLTMKKVKGLRQGVYDVKKALVLRKMTLKNLKVKSDTKFRIKNKRQSRKWKSRSKTI